MNDIQFNLALNSGINRPDEDEYHFEAVSGTDCRRKCVFLIYLIAGGV